MSSMYPNPPSIQGQQQVETLLTFNRVFLTEITPARISPRFLIPLAILYPLESKDMVIQS